MRRAFVAGVAITAIMAGSAFSADMPLKAPVYMPPAPSWTGWYVGVNAGYGWGADPVGVVGGSPFAGGNGIPGPALAASLAGVTTNLPVNTRGFIGGGQIGYNQQFGAIVAGIETDIQGTSIRGSGGGANVGSLAPTFPNDVVQTQLSASNRLNYLGTLRGQLGFTVSPAVLLYGTGGLAYGGVRSSTIIGQLDTGPQATGVNSPYGSAPNVSDTRIGWTAGAGLAWMLYSNWTAKVEYLHYDLGSVSYTGTLSNITVPPAPPGLLFYSLSATSSTRISGDIVRVGVNYKFW